MHYDCLVVDDEKALADSTAEYFNLFGVKTAVLYDGGSCLDFFRENKADLVLLDINLKDSSGFEICHRLRQTLQIPILFISARPSDDDILMALNIGGDDYVRKPYSLHVLLAKVKVVLKRFGTRAGELLSFGRITVDFAAERVFIDGEWVKMKAMEYKLLCYFLENKGRVITKEELFENVWKNTITSDGTLNVHIRHLREKIEINPNEPYYIKTVWGVGYLFEVYKS